MSVALISIEIRIHETIPEPRFISESKVILPYVLLQTPNNMYAKLHDDRFSRFGVKAFLHLKY